ncbi:hypothetical protein GEI7407_1847 [Geitlerinema sp. PCC 7407]|nr:hypothetical protein GEI7407_1847 [Geitlerinema sp. PCC 7407]
MPFLFWRRERSPRNDGNSAATVGPLLFPGVAVDAEETCIFYQKNEQWLVKRSLASDDLLWSVPLPGTLLAIIGPHLWLLEIGAAEAGRTGRRSPEAGTPRQCRFVALSSTTGQIAHTTPWLTLPFYLPTFRYESCQGSSLALQMGWSEADRTLWVQIDHHSWYAGGVAISHQALRASDKRSSALITLVPESGQAALVKTSTDSGRPVSSDSLSIDKESLALPPSCQTKTSIEPDWLATRGLRPLDSAQTLRHYIVLQAIPVDRPGSSLLLLEVFCRERSLLQWQQCIGTYYEEPPRC